MPLKNYGVLKAQAIARRLAALNSPHYQIQVTDGEFSHRIAVNVRSQQAPSEVLYFVNENFQHPMLEALVELPLGHRAIPSQPGGLALDFIRGNLVKRQQMTALPIEASGSDNDLNEKLERHVQRALSTEDAVVYAFGEKWGPETVADRYFGFKPGNGIHDIHMNQGSTGRFAGTNGPWQDGGLLIHFPSERRWIATFLAFQSQTFHTDDGDGGQIDVPPELDEIPIAIVAALVNPEDTQDVNETVTLLNRSDRRVSLNGWNLADKAKEHKSLSGIDLQPGAWVSVRIRDNSRMQLDNNGGIITLLDAQGIKIHGVSYTSSQAKKGWTVVF